MGPKSGASSPSPADFRRIGASLEKKGLWGMQRDTDSWTFPCTPSRNLKILVPGRTHAIVGNVFPSCNLLGVSTE